MDAQFGLQWAGLVDARLHPTETGRAALALLMRSYGRAEFGIM
jgi:hypothetical protein